uniref:Scol-Chitinase n=1 Tax=Scolopendra viridis TaxID=118503 RepID=A0A4D5RA82_SCOVI
MQSINVLVAALVAVLVVSAVADAYVVVCYYTNWSSYRAGNAKYVPEDVDPSLCTHVIYSFAILDANTYQLKPHDAGLDVNQGYYKKIVGLKQKNPSLKVLLAIGGYSDSQSNKYSLLVADASNRQKFIQHALGFLGQYGFDGLDLDWEYPAAGDKHNFGVFAKELKEAFKPKGLMVTAAVSGAGWKIDEAYDVPTLANYLDHIHIMAYDFKASWDGHTDHHAALYGDALTDDGSVKKWMQLGAPANKLVLGMPMYGRTWTLANPSQNGINVPSAGAGTAGQYTQEGGILAYYEICSMDWTKVVTDPSGKMGPYAYKGSLWTSYDDPAILKKKGEYVKQKGLAGAMIWSLDQDDFNGSFCKQGRYPLLTAINEGLGLK